jgi:hypothetical protein
MEVYALREIRKQQRRPQELRSGRGAVLLRSRCTVNTASVTLATASVTASKARTAVKQKKGSVQEEVKAKVDVAAVLKKASATAFRGGVAGFAAGVIQVRAGRHRSRRACHCCLACLARVRGACSGRCLPGCCSAGGETTTWRGAPGPSRAVRRADPATWV